MIPPEIRRSVLLQKAIKLALAGTLLTFASFSATAADPRLPTLKLRSRRIFCLARSLMMSRMQNSSPIRKPLLTPYLIAIRS